MIDQNLRILRKKCNLTQEQLAERMHVSRQTIAKWETGVSQPDIAACVHLADIFQIQLEDLLRERTEQELMSLAPRGKYLFGALTVGENGEITLPREAREVFGIQSGDTLILLGDADQGLALLPNAWYMEFSAAIQRAIEDKKS